MKRIYTRTGDRGTTGIHGGERVEKDDIRIEANGTIDELNAVIGIIRSLLPQEHDWQKNPNVLSPGLAAFCEQEMDTMTAGLKENGYFLLPGGTPVSAQLQFARTVARRAERRLWTLNRQDAVPEEILSFINRLSDLFFVMARFDMQQQDWPEERWQAFAYKTKKK